MTVQKKLLNTLFGFTFLLGSINIHAQDVTPAEQLVPEDTMLVAADVSPFGDDYPISTEPLPPSEQDLMLSSITTMLVKAKEENSRRSVMRNASLSEEECLATAMYHEARGEGELGMKAVAYVIYNRTQNPKWPKSVCGVVLQAHQFSFTNDRNPDNIKQWPVYEKALHMATFLLRGGFVTQSSPVKNATYFHSLARTAKNAYAFRRPLITKIGNHHFFR